MKLNTTIRFNGDPNLVDHIKRISYQVNLLSEGRMSARYTAAIAQPTTGAFQQGDFVINKTPSELGLPGARYVIEGWLCLVSGTPGTFVEKRFLTGN